MNADPEQVLWLDVHRQFLNIFMLVIYTYTFHLLEYFIGVLIRPSPTKKETSYIPHILWDLEVRYHIQKSPSPDPNLAK